MPAALLWGTLAAAERATATAFPASRVAFSTVIRATRSDAKHVLGVPGRDQLAAGRGLLLTHPHEHAGGANLKALAEALPLPRFIGQLFGFDRGVPTPLVVKARRIVGPLGPIHGPFNAAQFFPRLDDTRAELLEDGIALPDSGNIAGRYPGRPHRALSRGGEDDSAFLHELDLTSGNGHGFDGELPGSI